MKIYLSRVFLTWNEWFITQISSVRQLSRPAAAPLLSSLLTKSSDAGKYSKHFLRWFTKAAFVDQPRKFWMGSQTHFGARRVDVWHACIGSTVLTQARAFLMSGRFLPLEKSLMKTDLIGKLIFLSPGSALLVRKISTGFCTAMRFPQFEKWDTYSEKTSLCPTLIYTQPETFSHSSLTGCEGDLNVFLMLLLISF